jgi:hypothetical protein
MDRLKRYNRVVPRTTGEPASPAHDVHSHAGDAFGGLAEIVDRIRNEGERPAPVVAAYENADPSVGMLG